MMRNYRFAKFYRDIATRTPFVKMVVLLAVLWGTFAGGIYLAERGVEGTYIHSYGHALYWSIAAAHAHPARPRPGWNFNKILYV